MNVSCNLTTFKFFVRVPPGLYCHPIERAYCQVKPERIETHTGGAPGAGSGLRRLLGPGDPCPSSEGEGRARDRGCLQPPGRDHRHRSLPRSRSRQSSAGPAEARPENGDGATPGLGKAPGSSSFASPKHPRPAAPAPPGLRYHGCRQEGTYLGCPRCRQPPSRAGSPLIPKRRVLPTPSSHPRPLHLALPPLALSMAHFGSSGARLPSRKRTACEGLLFFSLFLSPLPVWKRGCELEKGG